jgi:hypothetical protein
MSKTGEEIVTRAGGYSLEGHLWAAACVGGGGGEGMEKRGEERGEETEIFFMPCYSEGFISLETEHIYVSLATQN